jgi:hypothetical protein
MAACGTDNGVVSRFAVQSLGRRFFKVAFMNDSSVGPLAWVNGSDAPEKA